MPSQTYICGSNHDIQVSVNAKGDVAPLMTLACSACGDDLVTPDDVKASTQQQAAAQESHVAQSEQMQTLATPTHADLQAEASPDGAPATKKSAKASKKAKSA